MARSPSPPPQTEFIDKSLEVPCNYLVCQFLGVAFEIRPMLMGVAPRITQTGPDSVLHPPRGSRPHSRLMRMPQGAVAARLALPPCSQIEHLLQPPGG